MQLNSPDSNPVSTETSPAWHHRKWFKYLVVPLGTIAVLYGMIYVDVLLRARHAFLEGEKYWRWHDHPQEKESEVNAQHQKQKEELDGKLSRNKISKDEYDRQLEILQFDRDRHREESSIKYAYVWYQTAYQLFSPPESKWVKLAREKAPLAKEKWKEELRAKKIPFEEYMLE